jgi:opacity protein-like surface antigen
MKTNPLFKRVAFGALMTSAPFVNAYDFYVGGSIGYADMDNLDTSGNFTTDFTTGTVTGVNPPLTIPAGERVNWDTEMDGGEAYGLVFGMKFDMFRAELEYSYTTNDVDGHDNVTAAGIALDGIDAGVLITGNVGDLGATVGEIVGNGQGEVETSTFFLNAYYDFKNSTKWTPFIGGGVGYSNVDVNYKPSDIGIIDDDDDVLAWQVMGGVAYNINDAFEVAGSIRYRKSEEADLSADLLPADFEIETETVIYDIGIRYNF